MDKPYPAYLGDDPYVFICYAHDDAERIYPEFRWLQDEGVRLWYDEGISPGSVWRTEIAQAIEKATLVLYYVSQGSVASDHCDREINYSLDQNVAVLPIYLETVELPPDQRIGLGRVQAIHRDTLETDHYRSKLISLLTDDGKPAPPVADGPGLQLRSFTAASAQQRRSLWWPAAAVIALLLIVGVAVFRWTADDPVAKANPDLLAFPMPDKPSLVVLPFTNANDDPDQTEFADGLTDDLITDLSRISDLFVIARNTAFSYRGKSVEIRQVAEELGIRYVLEGRIRRLANDARRVNVQLIDSTSGGTIWARRFDVLLGDEFAFHGEMTSEIAKALAVDVTEIDQLVVSRNETGNREAHEAFQAGWADYRENTPEHYAAAIPHFERAIALDPDYGRAHAALAAVYQASLSRDFTSGLGEWTRSLGLKPDDILSRVKDHLAKARLIPSPLTHQVQSQLRLYQGRFTEAIEEAERAVALDGNDPLGYETLGAAQILAGQADDGAATIDRALRLDPQNPQAYLLWKGLAEFGARDFNAAVQTLERARALNPRDDRVLIVLASTYGHLERLPKAQATIDALNALRSEREQDRAREPQRGIRLGIDIFLAGPYTQTDVDIWPFKMTPDRERLREGLRAAGLPEHSSAAESPLAVAGATTVDAVQAKALYDRGARMVDVRGVADWNIGHIVGVVHLELFEQFSEATLLEQVDQNDPVIIHCEGAKCLRSSQACEKAVAWGFTEVYYFRDGFPAWRAAGFPIESIGEL